MSELVWAWRPLVPGVDEVFHARFVEHCYPPHVHDTWTLIVIDDGAIRFHLDRRPYAAGTGTVSLLPPGIVHDGRAAVADGFRKRVIYLDVDVIGAELVGHTVDRPVWDDEQLRGEVDRLHVRLLQRGEELAAETALHHVAGELAERLRRRPQHDRRPVPRVAADARDLLDAHALGQLTLAEVAAQVGVGVPHLVRAFRGQFGVPPHRYVVGRRVASARRLLLAGATPADAAAATGFYDQPHLTRVFRRYTGTTPARFCTQSR